MHILQNWVVAMGEDEKMFQIGLWTLGAVVLLTIGLQVCYRTQNRARDHVRREIVRTQQEIAVATTNFSSYVRPEILRNMVTSVAPRAEVISFHKSVAIDELASKE
ncbi:MAG: hypothetical protein IJ560_00035 [Alphaproteobacteria bacterium]|nr:hypothetical protein [Alphaproteobacteria bacterium]